MNSLKEIRRQAIADPAPKSRSGYLRAPLRRDWRDVSSGDVMIFQEEARQIGVPLEVDGKPGRLTRRWCQDFQRGFAGGDVGLDLLKIDGIYGPKTRAAHSACADSGGKTSPHFSFEEFRTKNPKRVVGENNPIIFLNRDLVVALELVRLWLNGARIELDPVTITIISGFRDLVWNRRVGGAPLSQHLHGNAVDLSMLLGVLPEVGYAVGAGGIGHVAANGNLTHMDMRKRLRNQVPSRWQYNRAGRAVGFPNSIPPGHLQISQGLEELLDAA